MPLEITPAELAKLDTIVSKTRTALTEGATYPFSDGNAQYVQTIPPVVTPAAFAGSTPTQGREISDGTRLNAIGMIQALEDGLILRAPNGSYFLLTVSNAGAAVFTPVI